MCVRDRFYVLARPLAAVGGLPGAVLVGFTELFSLTPLLTPDRAGFLLAAGASGWGGLSVLCQTLAVLEGSGLSPRNCLLGKAVQAGFSLALAAVLRPDTPFRDEGPRNFQEVPGPFSPPGSPPGLFHGP